MAAVTSERQPFRDDVNFLRNHEGGEVILNRLRLQILTADLHSSPQIIVAESDENVYTFKVVPRLDLLDIPQELFIHEVKAPIYLWSYWGELKILSGSFMEIDEDSDVSGKTFELSLLSKKSKLPLRERIGKFFTRKPRE